MIDIIHMPLHSKSFGAVLKCVDLRKQGRAPQSMWIGQSEYFNGELEHTDRCESYHIVNHTDGLAVGYARLRLLDSTTQGAASSRKIFEIAEQSSRIPAFELQMVSTSSQSAGNNGASGSRKILRELLVEAFRIANSHNSRFIFTSCDRCATAEIKQLGLRYSTLSTPYEVEGRLLVVICIAVNNLNFSALSPLRIVGGVEAECELSPPPFHLKRRDESPTVFEKYQALREMIENEQGTPPDKST